jgi:predicted CxxxxCH...CXXCH cytochrome family protein
LAWVCAFFAFVASSATAEEPATPQARAASQLFTRYCVQCHGTDGRGEPGRKTLPEIPDFTDATWQQSRTDIQLRISILEGKNQHMPANRVQVNDAQAVALVAHIRTFGPRPPESAGRGESSDSSADFDTQIKQLQREWGELDKQLRALPVAAATKSAPSPTVHPAPSASRRAAVPERAPSWSAAPFFGENCAGCHTIGAGSLTGPDLKNVTGRKERDWLISYLQNPKAVIDRGDPYALHLLAEARGVVMPKPFGMTRERAESVLELIEAESKLEKSQFAGPPVSDAPFPPGDADRGRELFVGNKLFTNGGPACITCHTAYGLGRQEGGKLGPELTKAYERLGGRASLTARLWSPATPTMRPVYKDHALELDEVMCLVAYLEQEDKQGVEQSSAPPLRFFMMGLGGTVLALAALSFLFGNRAGTRPALETAASVHGEPTNVALSATD